MGPRNAPRPQHRLFRKLRLIFSRASPFFETITDSTFSFKLINELIDQVEDVYDSSVQNLDAFALDLQQNLGDHPITRTVQTTIDEFRVHYVLNLFNGVDDSFNTAVKPFLDNLTRNVSARCISSKTSPTSAPRTRRG